MLTAINGILIVVLLFWWGVHTGDARLMSLGLVSAVFAYVANFAVEVEIRPVWFAASTASAACAGLGILLAISKGF